MIQRLVYEFGEGHGAVRQHYLISIIAAILQAQNKTYLNKTWLADDFTDPYCLESILKLVQERLQ